MAPRVEERRYGKGLRHLTALCPTCGSFLGHLPRKRHLKVASPAVMEKDYHRYLAQAKANGARPGQAYFRFKIRYGIDPDPTWDHTA